MKNCVFCSSGIERFSFLNSKNFRVLYNRSPILPGHSLVIPKLHYKSLLDIPPEHISEMMSLSLQAVKLLMKIFNADGFDWTIQDGWTAGQTIPHLHVHLIPRKAGDLTNPGDWYHELEKPQNIDSDQRPKLGNEEMLAMIDFINGKRDL